MKKVYINLIKLCIFSDYKRKDSLRNNLFKILSNFKTSGVKFRLSLILP